MNLFSNEETTNEVTTYEPVEAKEVVDWIGNLRISQGERAGQAFPVLPWQREFLEAALAPDVQQAGLTVGRGNGKTTLIAALASAFIIGPLRQSRAEVPVVAASYAQARIAFEHVRSFCDAELFPKTHWRVTDSLNWSLLEHKPTRARLRVMSSNPKRAHGLAPALVIADEPAQWQGQEGERMYSALVTSMGKIPGARLIALGTRPSNGNHWFARLLETDAPGMVSHIYAAPDDADIFDEAAWKAANPSLDAMPTLRKAIAIEAEQCRKNPIMIPAFRALRLNQGVEDSDTVQRLVELDHWRRCCALEAKAEGPMVWGIDLGGSEAISAIACYWPMTNRLDTVAEVGNDPGLGQRGLVDGVGSLYEQAAENRELFMSDRRVPDMESLVDRALRKWGPPVCVVADRWRVAELRDVGERLLPSVDVVTRGQGYKDGADDTRRFRAAVALGHVVPCRRLFLLDSGVLEAVLVTDSSGNTKLAKGVEGGRRRRLRDDVAAAAILAVAHGVRGRENHYEQKQSMFETVG